MPLLILNKPYRVMSQFTDAKSRATLRDFIDDETVYPAGRLDFDSEGLLLLTDDGLLQEAIAHPRSKLEKSYWAQVEGSPDSAALSLLTSGVDLRDGRATALSARLIAEPPGLWSRDPPIRFRKSVPDSWIELVINEGRNRQVRRMTAAVALPTLRLIRHRVGPWSIDDLKPGETRRLKNSDAWRELEGHKG